MCSGLLGGKAYILVLIFISKGYGSVYKQLSLALQLHGVIDGTK